jgi:hypothetical protein
MIRGLVLTASFLLAGAVPALAQAHSPSHGQGHPQHGPGHVRPDSAQHAAMHALLHGTWKGAIVSPRGVSTALELAVAHDSLRGVALRMDAEQPLQAGAATEVVMEGAKLQWTQELSGASCKATAVLTAATPQAPETMAGRLACGDGERAFTLRKTTG